MLDAKSAAIWRMMQSDPNCSPRQIPLIIRENTENSHGFGPLGGKIKPKKPCARWSFCRNSLVNRTGNYFGGTGNLFDVTGNSIRRTW
jgi:hypothetical protein